MKLVRKVKQVKAYLPEKDLIIVGDNVTSLKTNKNITIDNAFRLFDLKDEILVTDNLNNPYFINEDLDILKKEIRFKIPFVTFPYLKYLIKTSPRTHGLINCIQKEKIFEINVEFGRDIFPPYIFLDDITCRDINTGNILWHFDISQFGQWKNFEDQDRNYEVEQFVGVSGGCLYVLLSNFKLIALHVETGELLHQLNLGEIFALEPRNWLSYSSKMHLDKVNNRIIWLSSATLLHIDLANFSAKLIKDFFNVPIENLWRFKCSNFQEQQLLFTAQQGREGGDPDIVGIMNPDTGEIDWQYQIQNTEGLYEEPQLANNKLYVRSLDNDLYIFGKQ